MKRNNRPLASPSVDTTDLHPALPILWAAVEGNLGRARRRYLRTCGTPIENGEIALDNGLTDNGITSAPEPWGDELLPAEKDLPLNLPPPLHIIHCIKDPRDAAQMDASLPNAPTPNRPGDPLDPPSNKEARTSRDTEEPTEELNLEEYGLPSGDDETIRPGVKPEDREHATGHLP